MAGRLIFFFAVILWLGIYTWSFSPFILTEPTGDGFTRGMNRVTTFLGWQLLAGLVALGIWRGGRIFERSSAGRWIARLPILLFSLLVLAIAAFFIYGIFFV